MTFRYFNPKRVERFVPKWAVDPFRLAKALDDAMGKYMSGSLIKKWDAPLCFWIEIQEAAENLAILIKENEATCDDSAPNGRLIMRLSQCDIVLPLNDMLKGSVDPSDLYCLYYHYAYAETPSAYFGITKRPWFVRYAEHKAAAERGSRLLFHRNLRENADRRMMLSVMVAGLSEDAALKFEEEFVEAATLYPLGLNMIPGGRAGLAYLSLISGRRVLIGERDAALRSAVDAPTSEGRSNPLCAARWESDPDYAARVICGHSGRLTADQVRAIRLMSGAGRSVASIADFSGTSSSRVASVLSGRRYGRVR